MDAKTLQQILDVTTKNMATMVQKILDKKTKEGNQTTEFVVNSMATRLPEFNYDPDNEEIFETWLTRFESILSVEGSNLADSNKAALVISKLSPLCFSKFLNHIAPRKPNEVGFPELTELLNKLFGPTSTTFSRRFAFLKLTQEEETLTDFAGRINRQHAIAQMETITGEQLKTLVLVLGIPATDSDVRTRALRTLEERPETSLNELTRALQGYIDMKHDAQLTESSAKIFAIQRQNKGKPNAANRRFNARHKPAAQRSATSVDCSGQYEFSECPDRTRMHSSNASYNRPTRVGGGEDQRRSNTRHHRPTCVGCGGQHVRSECRFRTAQCYECQGTGHIAKVCRQANSQQNVQANGVVANVGTNQSHVDKRIFKNVTFGRTQIRLCLDTGADITILSKSDWQRIGSPELKSTKISLTTADHRRIAVLGNFKCEYKLDGSSRFGTCHVAETTSVLGMDWLSEDPSFQKFARSCNLLRVQSGKDSNSDHGTSSTYARCQEFDRIREKKCNSPPKPQANGHAERFVNAFERALLKVKKEGKDKDFLQVFLQTYGSSSGPFAHGRRYTAKVPPKVHKKSDFRKEKGRKASVTTPPTPKNFNEPPRRHVEPTTMPSRSSSSRKTSQVNHDYSAYSQSNDYSSSRDNMLNVRLHTSPVPSSAPAARRQEEESQAAVRATDDIRSDFKPLRIIPDQC